MRRTHGVALLLVAALLGGCATTRVEQAGDLSSAGVAYARATAAVIDLAIDAAIDTSSERQILTKPRQPVSPQDQAQRERNLRELDETLIETVSKYSRLKRSVVAVEAYFVALQQLADGSAAEGTEAAVKSLADRLNGLNAVMSKGDAGAPLISEERQTAIGALAGLVAKQVHGATLGRALERDAATVGRALALQEIILEQASEDIRAGLDEANQRFYARRVVGPYRSGDIDDSWAADRRAYVKVRALGRTAEAVAAAETASRQMQTVWARILSGEYSARELTVMLKDTEDLLAAVAAFRQAEQGK